VINDRFTLILGKLKKNDVSSYVNASLQKCLKQLNCISIEIFIDIFNKSKVQYLKLKKALELPHYLITYSQKSKRNSEIIFQLYSVYQNFKDLAKFNKLLTKKEKLLNELEMSKVYEKESAISTITELIDNLEENIKKNRKKLTYFEEDYIKRKNQIDSIKKHISESRNQIAELNQKKKSYFSEINRITRRMENTTKEKPEKKHNGEKQDNIPNSEKIKRLQINAREKQYQINQLRAKIDEKKSKIARFEPQFKIFEKDHNKIMTLIQNDETRIKELKEKLKNEIQETKLPLSLDNQKIEELDIRSKKEIETEINLIERKLAQIEIPKDYYNLNNPQDFSKIQNKILELKNEMKNTKDQIEITGTEKEISQIIQNFEFLENLIKQLETLVNLFVKKINLKSQFLITMNNDKKDLFIEIIFTRNEKERTKFENLTTPEKVFFAIVFYLSIEMLNNSKYIVFSNILIPEDFNKRGSTERTIRKILPLFNKEALLSDTNLIFIISNLDINSDINNLKLIKIEES
jgi:chromosome segregation ATPase